MAKGFLMLVLHAHLPYVRHPEHEFFLEERWLYEAVVETYVPLLDMLGRIADDGVDCRLTVSLSPTLLEMLSDPLLNERLRRHMEALVELSEKEVLRTRRDASFGPTAHMYLERTRRLLHAYEYRMDGDIIGALRDLGSTGRVELITTAATHAYLPNLVPHRGAVAAQVKNGLATFKRHIGKAPSGFWLPECGYSPGLDETVARAGPGYFFLESHGVLHARPRPGYGVYRPIRTPAGTAAFGRDAATARKVWCAATGYPGDPDYRDFYRDIGYDLPMDYIRDYIHPDGIRIPTGLKYHRVTGGTDRKKPYDPERAMKKAEEHASGFIRHLVGQARSLGRSYGFPPLAVAPYDAELFGHWWYEGVQWLEFLLRGLHRQRAVRTVTAPEYIGEFPRLQTAVPQLSSWGEGGYSATWTAERNGRAVAEIHRSCRRMERLVENAGKPPLLAQRALNQALRELLLAQSSDWTFLMHRGTSAEYAEARLAGHLRDFHLLARMVERGEIDPVRLCALEEQHALFPDIDYRSYGSSLA